jgi:hypothetical protein
MRPPLPPLAGQPPPMPGGPPPMPPPPMGAPPMGGPMPMGPPPELEMARQIAQARLLESMNAGVPSDTTTPRPYPSPSSMGVRRGGS